MCMVGVCDCVCVDINVYGVCVCVDINVYGRCVYGRCACVCVCVW